MRAAAISFLCAIQRTIGRGGGFQDQKGARAARRAEHRLGLQRQPFAAARVEQGLGGIVGDAHRQRAENAEDRISRLLDVGRLEGNAALAGPVAAQRCGDLGQTGQAVLVIGIGGVAFGLDAEADGLAGIGFVRQRQRRFDRLAERAQLEAELQVLGTAPQIAVFPGGLAAGAGIGRIFARPRPTECGGRSWALTVIGVASDRVLLRGVRP